MSLVAYGSSDSEEETDIRDETISCSTKTSNLGISKGKTEEALLSAEKPNEEESKEQDKSISGFITNHTLKKQRETIKITLPSLDQFKDEESEPKKKPQFKSGSGLGLFSILPPPKHTPSATTHSFTPYVLTKQKDKIKPLVSSQTKKETAIHKTHSDVSSVSKVISDSTKATDAKQTEQNEIEESDLDDTASKVDYFSLDTPHTEINSKFSDISTSNTSSLFTNLPEPTQTSFNYDTMQFAHENSSSAVTSSNEEYTHKEHTFEQIPDPEPLFQEGSARSSFLNDKEFLKITGKRGKEEIDIIDVNADDQLTGKDEWLMQSLTEERVERPSKRRHDMPTQQQKRKHQITYLAFRAKERELDLKNQWAMNSLTRRETQAKYGF